MFGEHRTNEPVLFSAVVTIPAPTDWHQRFSSAESSISILAGSQVFLFKSLTSWWLSHPVEKYGQIGSFPLVGWEHKKCLKPPTSKVLEIDSNPLTFNECNLNSLSWTPPSSPTFFPIIPKSSQNQPLVSFVGLQTSRTLGKSILFSQMVGLLAPWLLDGGFPCGGVGCGGNAKALRQWRRWRCPPPQRRAVR